MFQILNKLTPETVTIFTNEDFHITVPYEPSTVHHKHNHIPQPGGPTLRVANQSTLTT